MGNLGETMETIPAALLNGLGFGVCELGYELRELCIEAGEGTPAEVLKMLEVRTIDWRQIQRSAVYGFSIFSAVDWLGVHVGAAWKPKPKLLLYPHAPTAQLGGLHSGQHMWREICVRHPIQLGLYCAFLCYTTTGATIKSRCPTLLQFARIV